MKELPERIHDDTNGLDYVLVCGLSFRHAADRDSGGKSRRYHGAWEGGGTD